MGNHLSGPRQPRGTSLPISHQKHWSFMFQLLELLIHGCPWHQSQAHPLGSDIGRCPDSLRDHPLWVQTHDLVVLLQGTCVYINLIKQILIEIDIHNDQVMVICHKRVPGRQTL